MSDSNYVNNSSNTAQQSESLGPDGSQVDQAPVHEINSESSSAPTAWRTGPRVKDTPIDQTAGWLPHYEFVSMEPATPAPQSSGLDYDAATSYPVADTGLTDDRRPKVTPPGSSFLRSLVRFTIWQDPVLAGRSQLE